MYTEYIGPYVCRYLEESRRKNILRARQLKHGRKGNKLHALGPKAYARNAGRGFELHLDNLSGFALGSFFHVVNYE